MRLTSRDYINYHTLSLFLSCILCVVFRSEDLLVGASHKEVLWPEYIQSLTSLGYLGPLLEFLHIPLLHHAKTETDDKQAVGVREEGQLTRVKMVAAFGRTQCKTDSVLSDGGHYL